MAAPAALVRSYLTMLPRLQAEEQLASVRTASLGAGLYEPADAKALLSDLEDRARGQARKVRKARPADLAAMGIGVVSALTSAPSEKALSDG